MSDILDDLAASASERVKSGFYELEQSNKETKRFNSFVRRIKEINGEPIIAEVKIGSPSRGRFLSEGRSPNDLGRKYLEGGAAGLSVLTDPDHFFGSLENLEKMSRLNLPTLMKDFVLDFSQIKAGFVLGASAILLIYRLFDRDYPTFTLKNAIDGAHQLGLEVLLETNDRSEYEKALDTNADMIGINNRDLRSLEVDLSVTKNILDKLGKDRITWSMSGITKREDIDYLNTAGADAFLVGTSLARAREPVIKLREMRGAIND